MNLLDVLTAPWAIQPEMLEEIQGIYLAHARGDKADLAAVEARLGRPLANEPKPYQIIDGVAVVEAVGVSAKRANLFMQISGGVSTELLARDLRNADADQAVHSVILRADTPGGTVDGTQILAQVVRGMSKPIVTLAGGTLASAGYWYGSAAQQVYIEDGTTAVGSIGVVAKHIDLSAAREARGEKHTEIVAGKYKRIASDNGPLTKEGRATIQDQVDHIYSVFVQAVAAHRGVDVDRVLADMADGRVFLGQRAIDAGLVDGITSLDELVAQLNPERAGATGARAVHLPPPPAPTQPSAPQQPKGAVMTTPTPPTATTITREQLAASAPDLLKSILAEGHAAGAKAERERIQAVEAALIPGHEKLIASLKFDGQSTGGDAALAVLQAERQVRAGAARDLASDAPAPVKPAAAPAVDKPAADAAADANLPVEERCKAKWEADAKVRAEFGTLAAYTAFTRAEEQGRVRRIAPRAA